VAALGGGIGSLVILILGTVAVAVLWPTSRPEERVVDERPLEVPPPVQPADQPAVNPPPVQPPQAPAFINNPGFEAGTNGWEVDIFGAPSQVVADTTILKEGRQSLRVSATVPSDTALGQEVQLKPKQVYRLTGWVRTQRLEPLGSPVYGTLQVQKPHGTGTIESGANHAGDTEWTQVTVAFESPPDGKVRVAVFFVGFGRGTGTAWFDDLRLVEAADLAKGPNPAKSLAVRGWGDAIDPDGDCTITPTGSAVTMDIPGTHHDLWPQGNKLNSPRIVQEIEGAFLAQVEVGGLIRAEPGTEIRPGAGVYRAGGLVVWKDQGEFIRLERGAALDQGKSAVRVWLEALRGAGNFVDKDTKKPIIGNGALDLLDVPTLLRLERRQGKFTASYSYDKGKNWKPHSFGPFTVDLPDRLKVGVAAINNSTQPLKVDFGSFVVTRLPGGGKGSGRPNGPGRPVYGFGEYVDPDGDCTLTSSGSGRLLLSLPGGYHDLWPGPANVNSAPRVLQPVEGDFVAQVKASGFFRTEPGTRVGGGASPFRSGGLLVWIDNNNFLRLERAGYEQDGKNVAYCHLECYQNGKLVVDGNTGKRVLGTMIADSFAIHLRMERRGRTIIPSYSHDGGKTWQTHAFGSFQLDLPAKVQVGVACVNNTSRQLVVTFDDLQITRPGAGEKK
jgi:regulation of enolase protein 1 (concanavalin A-like superfamily)